MRTLKIVHLAVGIAMIIVGGLFLTVAVGVASMSGHVCATTLVGADLLGVPRCGSNRAGFSALAMFGIMLVALAGIIIFDGRTKLPLNDDHRSNHGSTDD